MEVTASAGNMAQGVAWMARKLGIESTIIAPATAPDIKIKAIERLGGRVIKVSFDEWWRAFEERAFSGVDGAFIHAFDDPDVMAGNGTIALEVLEDLSDVDAIVVPWGGGGLTCGIASVPRELRPTVRSSLRKWQLRRRSLLRWRQEFQRRLIMNIRL